MTMTGDGVCHFQPADAIGDAQRAQAAHARVSVGAKTGALLVAGDDGLERAAAKLLVKAEHVIAGNAKDMPHTVRAEAPDEIIANGGGRF